MRAAAVLYRSLALVAGAVIGGVLVLAFVPRVVRAQNILTQTSSASLTIPQPTVADYNALFSAPASITYSVDADNPGGTSVARIATIKIRCQSVTGGSKTCADVQWSSTSPTTVGWTDLTTSFVTVVSRCMKRSSATPPSGCVDAPAIGEPWTGNISVRMKLSWTADAPGAYQATVNLTLEVYAQ